MAAGYRSYAFSWFTGYASDVITPAPGCPCPVYRNDETLSDNWISDACNVNLPSLPYTIPIFRLYMLVRENLPYKSEATIYNQFLFDGSFQDSYNTPATLANAWQRKDCD